MGALMARKTLVQIGFSAVPLISNLLKTESRVHACFPLFYSIGDSYGVA